MFFLNQKQWTWLIKGNEDNERKSFEKILKKRIFVFDLELKIHLSDVCDWRVAKDGRIKAMSDVVDVGCLWSHILSWNYIISTIKVYIKVNIYLLSQFTALRLAVCRCLSILREYNIFNCSFYISTTNSIIEVSLYESSTNSR